MIGHLITTRLDELKQNQSDLARSSGFSRAYISDLCRDRSGKRLPISTLNRLAKGLRYERKKFYKLVSEISDKSKDISDERSIHAHVER